MIRTLLWLVPSVVIVLFLGAIARRVPTVAAAMAATDTTLAHVVRDEPLPDSVWFDVSDSLEQAQPRGAQPAEGAATARFAIALRAGPFRLDRSGPWETAVSQATQWPPSDEIPTMTLVTLADGRQFFIFAGQHKDRWYVHGAQAQR